MEAPKKPLCWGIASAGRISCDFVGALKSIPDSQHKVVAVAARALVDGRDFARDHKIPRFYEGYQYLARDPEVDVVYVGCVNSGHYEVARMMLENGKHVLCEKPLCMNEKQTRALVQIANDRRLFLMEAVWSRFFPAYEELTKVLDAEVIGEILQLTISFGFDLQHVERLKSRKLGGGTVLDLGIYLLQFQQLVFKRENPLKVVNAGGLNSHRTDDYFSSFWIFNSKKVSFLSASALAEYPNEAVIVGTKGIIRVPDFWCPTSFSINEKTFNFPLPKSTASFNFHNSVGLAYEAEHVRLCIQNGQLQSNRMSLADSIRLASQMDIIRRDIGVVFDEDQ